MWVIVGAWSYRAALEAWLSTGVCQLLRHFGLSRSVFLNIRRSWLVPELHMG